MIDTLQRTSARATNRAPDFDFVTSGERALLSTVGQADRQDADVSLQSEGCATQ